MKMEVLGSEMQNVLYSISCSSYFCDTLLVIQER